MFLTRMSLDVNRPATRSLLLDPMEMQRVVEASFEGVPVVPLWRVQPLNHRMHLVMISPLRPTLNEPHETYGYPGCFPSWDTQVMDGEIHGLYPGARYSFWLDAAVVTGLQHLTPEEQLEYLQQVSPEVYDQWLHAQAEANGFTVKAYRTEQYEPVLLSQDDGVSGFMIQKTIYTGILTVHDPDRLGEAMLHGIGEVRRWGVGMLTLDEPNTWH